MVGGEQKLRPFSVDKKQTVSKLSGFTTSVTIFVSVMVSDFESEFYAAVTIYFLKGNLFTSN